MPCTTILVGKKASYDGSTLMARNEDSGGGTFDPKKFIAVTPDQQPRHYKAILSSFEMDLPENPMRYTAMPNAIPKEGIWGEAGFNEENIAMSETETITASSLVLGADPLVKEGIGEEDMLTIVLPYIHSAKDGVRRLGALLEKYGTYEMNGIGFQDMEEIWWFESLGGHHWLAKRVPDDAYVVMPNQRGIDTFDLKDAFGDQKTCMCSADLLDFIRDNFLDPGMGNETPLEERTDFDARGAFGTRADSDHVYNTPRAWFMLKYLNPRTYQWEGEGADYTPESDDLPWSMVPEKKVTLEDIKYVLSGYYQGTQYNVYNRFGDTSMRGKYRPIGINRNNFVAITQLRHYVPKEIAAVEWIAEGSNAFNTMVPFYGNVNDTPDYLRDTTEQATTENFYWVNRLIGVMADAHFAKTAIFIERYQNRMEAGGHSMIREFDAKYMAEKPSDVPAFLEECNQKLADFAKENTDSVLNEVLFAASNEMKNAFSRADA